MSQSAGICFQPQQAEIHPIFILSSLHVHVYIATCVLKMKAESGETSIASRSNSCSLLLISDTKDYLILKVMCLLIELRD